MFKWLFSLSLFATVVFAQGALIGLPTYNQTVNPGSSLIVQVQRPDSLTSSEEVAVVIGLQSCPDNPCSSPSATMGTVLYNGPFNPQFQAPGPSGNLPPYENFTVQVPSSIAQGTALIGVVHVTLVGLPLYPLFEILNQTITIA